MNNFKRVAISATTSVALVLTAVPAANAQMSSMSSLLSSSGPSASAPEKTHPDWILTPAPAPQPDPVPSDNDSAFPSVYLTLGMKDNLESIMEISVELYAMRGGAFPRVQNDNLAVAYAQGVRGLDYEGPYDFSFNNTVENGVMYSVSRYSWEYAYVDRGNDREDVVAPDLDGLHYGSHVTSDDDFIYVVMAYTARTF